MGKALDLVGQKFNLLSVREMLPGIKCLCDCECGTVGYVANRYTVKSGGTKSCGCLVGGQYHKSHGESIKGQWTPEYRAWSNAITRCHNPNATRFKNWGGRGIIVCDEWRESYPAFLAHVGRKPTPKHSLDRWPNPDGHYEPGNVRWATGIEQANNRRKAA